MKVGNKVIIEIPKIEHFIEINNIARQVHDIHVKWNSDLFLKVENPIEKERLEYLIKEQKIFVIKNSNEILGYMIIDIKESIVHGLRYRKVLKIENLGVDESTRGKGLGTKLLEFAKEKAKENNCTDIYLTVNEENEKAIKLYEKLGFSVRNIAYQMKL